MSVALVVFVVTLAASLAGLFAWPQIIERSVFRPYWFTRRRQYETLFTSGFVHADLAHLIFNMLTFWFFAFMLERQIGPERFAALYLFALVVSSLGTWRKHRNDPQYATLGASGAISAVLFAAIVYSPGMSLFTRAAASTMTRTSAAHCSASPSSRSSIRARMRACSPERGQSPCKLRTVSQGEAGGVASQRGAICKLRSLVRRRGFWSCSSVPSSTSCVSPFST
jgi:Ca2+/Na+ antiporter